MLTLWRKFNFRNVRLSAASLGERVAIVRRDGTLDWGVWMGFIPADAARAIPNARPARLLIHRIGETEFRDLAPGEYIHGCQLGDHTWAVVDLRVRIVPGPLTIRRPGD